MSWGKRLRRGNWQEALLGWIEVQRKDAFGLSNWGPSLTEPVFGEPGNIANIKELKPR